MSDELEKLYKDMAQSIIDGDSDVSVELAKKSIELNIPPLDAITKGFVVGVNYIGDQFGGRELLPFLGNMLDAERIRILAQSMPGFIRVAHHLIDLPILVDDVMRRNPRLGFQKPANRRLHVIGSRVM